MVKQICMAAVLLCGIASAQSNSGASYPYLLRLEHSTFTGHSCALLQTTGAFHLEFYHGDDIKVFEGSVPANDLLELEGDLNDESVVDLSQPQVEEPLLSTQIDELQVSIYRGDAWQDLFFRSRDSERPFDRWLQPLVRWLDNLHKLPHRELSEDQGKNNCLPRKPIRLRTRDAGAAPDAATPKTTAQILAIPASRPHPQPAQPRMPRPVPALLRVYSFAVQSGGAHESCVLLGENGMYRFEDRAQKVGKPVNTKIAAGQITPDDLQQLRHILDDPALAAVQHHEPPGHGDVPVIGDLLDITVSRPAGVQHVILSSRFRHPDFVAFYSGDADSSLAQPLLKFLSDHVENNPPGILDPSKRNGCSEAP
jgi:hypothetical protein